MRSEQSAEFYRKKARHCLELARRAADWDAKQTLLDVAAEYDQLAKEAERKK